MCLGCRTSGVVHETTSRCTSRCFLSPVKDDCKVQVEATAPLEPIQRWRVRDAEGMQAGGGRPRQHKLLVDPARIGVQIVPAARQTPASRLRPLLHANHTVPALREARSCVLAWSTCLQSRCRRSTGRQTSRATTWRRCCIRLLAG